MNKLYYYILAVFLFASCATRQEIVYLQPSSLELDKLQEIYAPKIQQEDLITIVVSAPDLKAVTPFNQQNAYQLQAGAAVDMAFKPTYLVDSKGEIDFPILGKLKIGGLTRIEAVEFIRGKLKEYINDPAVNLTFANFKVTVLGEVNKPGTFTLPQERITLLEAIGLAGDLTIKGVRNNVLLIREQNGVKKMERLNLLSDSILQSPFYYLAQNDVIYVEPNTSQVRNSRFGQDTNVWISITSLLITITALVVTNSKK